MATNERTGTTPPPAVPLGEYHAYMRHRGYARNTIAVRIAVARDWLAFTGGHLDVDHHDVERWITNRHVGTSSTRNLLVALRALYRWVRREALCATDPTALVDPPKVELRLPRPAPDGDIARLYTRGDIMLRAVLALMACAGLRCIEVSRLDWSDVDLDAGTVIVNGKGRRERLISLSDELVRDLAAVALATPGRRYGPVFAGPTGRRMSPARVSQYVNRAFRALGSTITAHQLRHRCATAALAECDGDLLAVRDLLGHSSVSTTQIYTAVRPGRTAATSRALRMPRDTGAQRLPGFDARSAG